MIDIDRRVQEGEQTIAGSILLRGCSYTDENWRIGYFLE
jgi:hypothetical protein